MKTFCVKLNIQAGEYRKSAIHLVMEANEADAVKRALLNECHDEESA